MSIVSPAISRNPSSSPLGKMSSMSRAGVLLLFQNAWGTPRGLKTYEPVGAMNSRSPIIPPISRQLVLLRLLVRVFFRVDGHRMLVDRLLTLHQRHRDLEDDAHAA